MKRQWQIRRSALPVADGQRRWDRAYQQLLSWATPPPAARDEPGEEVGHARSHLCAGLDAAAGAGADD